jgi:hypothetical protein
VNLLGSIIYHKDYLKKRKINLADIVDYDFHKKKHLRFKKVKYIKDATVSEIELLDEIFIYIKAS